MHKIAIFIFGLILLTGSFRAQTDTTFDTNSKKRKIAFLSTSGVVTLGSLVGLNQAWYNEYNTGKFHFFNDNKEWQQMDKAGHLFTTYQMGRLLINDCYRAGFNKKQQLIIGGGMGFAYMTAIECMDGFSRGWGFSWGDQLADVIGTSLAIAQHAIWNEQRFQIRFSYAQSGLAAYNPNLLGKNYYTQILKDYNAQTYWLSFNPFSFIEKYPKFPKWLNLSFGYGAYGMLGGYTNQFLVKDANGNILKIERVRRYYLSFDVDLTKIKTKSKVLKRVFSAFNILKFPAPAIELSSKKLRFYPIYY